MDSLALLCNLYGDGPATVRRLREAGLGSLESIDKAEAEKLAGLLRTSVRSALRFQAEGRLLLERTTAAVERNAEPQEQETPTDPVLRKVLDTWRRMDAEDEAAQAAEPSSEEPLPAPAAEPRELPTQPDGASLDAAALDGLDADVTAALLSGGVSTLEQLALCDGLAVSAACGLAYTRLLRLQLLARRALAARSRAEGSIEHGMLRPSPPPASGGASPSPARSAADAPGPQRRFSPAEGPPSARPDPLEPVVHERVDRRAAADAPAADAEGLESAGPFA